MSILSEPVSSTDMGARCIGCRFLGDEKDRLAERLSRDRRVCAVLQRDALDDRCNLAMAEDCLSIFRCHGAYLGLKMNASILASHRKQRPVVGYR
jgi:hypothetical protein